MGTKNGPFKACSPMMYNGLFHVIKFLKILKFMVLLVVKNVKDQFKGAMENAYQAITLVLGFSGKNLGVFSNHLMGLY